MTKGCQSRAIAVPTPSKAVPTKRSNNACTKVASTCTKGPALVCEDIDVFLHSKSKAYRALLVQRPQIQFDIQEQVDKIAASEAFNGEEQSLQEDIDIHHGEGCGQECLSRDLSEKARSLAAQAVQAGLPKDLGCQIEQDLEQIGAVLTKLVPTATKVLLKLDIMGLNSCCRWHRDHYVGRAVITYNSCGTEYIANDHVNMRALEQGGVNGGIVPDESRITQANVGDILFMKGTVFPSAPNGLVHRSPPMRFHEDGKEIMNRLLLKVDLN